MIQPAPGVAFTEADDGDQRSDPTARREVSSRLGIPREWATVDQVHGDTVHVVGNGGTAGGGDALVTSESQLPLAVFTADCLGVVLTAPGITAVAHAGWRGLAAGVLERTVETMARADSFPRHAYIGPAIGPCCFEVGPEVAARFEAVATTTWGTTSVDLAGEARRRLAGIEVEVVGGCTMCGGGLSHRLDATSNRMSALGWLG